MYTFIIVILTNKPVRNISIIPYYRGRSDRPKLLHTWHFRASLAHSQYGDLCVKNRNAVFEEVYLKQIFTVSRLMARLGGEFTIALQMSCAYSCKHSLSKCTFSPHMELYIFWSFFPALPHHPLEKGLLSLLAETASSLELSYSGETENIEKRPY